MSPPRPISACAMWPVSVALGAGTGAGNGLFFLRKMDARRVRDEGLWDSVRLKDIHPARETAYGG